MTDSTGLFFSEQTPASLVEAIRRFDTWEERFEPAAARANARRFGLARFCTELAAQVDALLC